MKDQPPSRALPCANPLDFHVEVQGRVNTALSSLSFGWACSLAATAQLCAGSDGARRATGGVPLAGQAHGSGHCEEGAGGGLQGSCSWGHAAQALLAGWCPTRRTWKCCVLELAKFPGSCSLIFQERGQSKPSDNLVCCFS